MKKICSLLLSGIITVSATAQFTADKTPVIVQSLAGSSIKNVDAETSGGNIAVTGVDAGEAKLELYAVPNNAKANSLSAEEIKQRMKDDYEVKIDVSNNKLTVTAKPKNKNMNWKKALSISFKIYVPANVSSDLSTSGGNIDLKNLNGNEKFSTSGGNLAVYEVVGKIDGTTSGGNITIENCKDDIELVTSGGNIDAKNCNGKIKLTTSGGNVSLVALKGTIKANTSGGNIEGEEIEGELVSATSGGNLQFAHLSGSVEASTNGGNINVAVVKLGEYVRLTNSGGDVTLDLPKNSSANLHLSADKIKTDKLENFSGKLEDEKVEGTLNGGGATVTVKADGGRINLGLK